MVWVPSNQTKFKQRR